jgi:hypothetical protein
MKFSEGFVLSLISGLVLFGVDYFLPNDIALQGAAFTGGLIGYIIYIRISNWKTDNEAHKDLFMFGITLLMSLWTSLLLLAACNFVFKEPLCTDNRRNGFIIANFFFPVFIVFVSWIMNRRPKSI